MHLSKEKYLIQLSSRIFSAALAAVLAVLALCLLASAAKYDTLTFPDATDNQITYAAQQAAKEAEFTSRGLPYVEYTPTGRMVWTPTHGGTKYHSHSGCSNMKGPQKVDLGYAEARGFDACKRCY